MDSIAYRRPVYAAVALAVAGCGNSSASSEESVEMSGAGSPAADASSQTEGGTPSEAGAPQPLVRIANFVPDAPASGFDFCLAPTGASAWTGPWLQQAFAPGSLGQGGPNGIQFSAVSAYFPVPAGAFDLQVVATGASDCTTGVIPLTLALPALAEGARVTFALVGDLTPTGNDPPMKVAAFVDDARALAPAGIALRAVNAVPSIPRLDVGTGSLGNGNYSPLMTNIPFGSAGTALVDAGSADPNGYAMLNPLSDIQFSAHQSGVETDDRATATHLTLTAGSATTLVVVNGKTGGRLPQFIICTDNGAPAGTRSDCNVVAQ